MILFKELTAVILGGAFGSVSRFILSRYISMLFPKNFPWGIFFVNLTGCLLMGIVAALFMHKYASNVFIRTFIMIGFLGGFTTFSSFSIDTLTLLQAGELLKALFYVLSSVMISIFLTAIAFVATKVLIP